MCIGETLEAFPLKSGRRKNGTLFSTIQHCIGSCKKCNELYRLEKKENKLLILDDNAHQSSSSIQQNKIEWQTVSTQWHFWPYSVMWLLPHFSLTLCGPNTLKVIQFLECSSLDTQNVIWGPKVSPGNLLAMKMPGSTLDLLLFNKTPPKNSFSIQLWEALPTSLLFLGTLHMLFFFSGIYLPFFLISQLKHFNSNSNFPNISDWDGSLPCVLSEHSVLFLHSIAFVTDHS